VLIRKLKEKLSVPIHYHAHYTSGMASMGYLEAIRAGVDIVDTCLAPFALRTSQPAVETIVATFFGTTRDPGLDLNLLLELDEYLEQIAPKYRDYAAGHRMSVIDTGVIVHQVPGGMVSNLVSQLKEAKALDRLLEVYKEVSVTRKELGMPPLATPTSQIVGVQAVLNVLFGRYKMVTNEVKDLVYGLYGRTPVPIDQEIQEKVLKGYKRGEKPITGRPADYLEPELDKAREKIGGLAKDDYDLLIYTLYPSTGEKFLRWKYGLDKKPPEIKPKTLEDIRKEDEAMAAALEKICAAH
jgi:pyruvate/oxaloacetate carboxyltransferase